MFKGDFLSKGDPPIRAVVSDNGKRGTNKKVVRCEVILVTKIPLMAFAKIIKLYCIFVSVLAPLHQTGCLTWTSMLQGHCYIVNVL